jgi:hypothetical protein
MSTVSLRDSVLKRPAALGGRLHFRTRSGHTADSLRLHEEIFAAPQKQVLNHFRWFWSDMLKDAVQLTTWMNKKARP